MSLNSTSFIVFFATVYLVLMFAKNAKSRKVILLIASFCFYAINSVRFAMLLAVYIVVIYYLCKIHSDNCLKLSVAISVGMLALFKYYNFFIESFSLGTLSLKLLIPLGISFYCFRGISYAVDVYRGKYDASSSLLSFALYIAYFPEIISGPISRYNDIAPQFEENKQNVDNLLSGMQMFVIGMFKKVVLADNLATFIGTVYSNPQIYSSISVVLAVIAYSLEIYLDFSGYSDMSIGVSRMLGYNIKKNFDVPYISRNVTEFWKRWHISLSSWLQEYVYYPLGGNRKGRFRQYVNLFMTMAIGGLWHGASWTFVVWGCLQGFALIIHKIYMNVHKSRNREKYTWNVLLTYIFITMSWVPFSAASFEQMIAIFKGIFEFRTGVLFISSWAVISIIVVAIAYWITILKSKNSHQNSIHAFYPLQNLSTLKGQIVFFLIVACILCFGYTGGSPFIYAAF